MQFEVIFSKLKLQSIDVCFFLENHTLVLGSYNKSELFCQLLRQVFSCSIQMERFLNMSLQVYYAL